MMGHILALFCVVVSSVLLSSAVLAQIDACGDRCKFRFCTPYGTMLPKGPRFLLRPPPSLSFPSICRPGRNVGVVRSTGEAILLLKGGEEIPISQWRPNGLSPKLPRKFFKVGKGRTMRESGIRSSTIRGNQQKFLDNLCVKLPIKTYEIVEPRTNKLKEVVKADDKDTDCVSFRTRTTKILIELSWDSMDDFDLYVTEPDGKQLSRFQQKTETAKLIGDFITDGCIKPFSESRETAVYADHTEGVQRGTYNVEGRHLNNCGGGPTKWRLRISINGILVKTKRGTSNGDGDVVIAKSTFMF